ncbi:hypothetical protein ANCDUO_21938 [Ancylostoma duodenale]|uniref:Uncharacterized protein n=1 Tax=Ancylostoma duodenale TaxID=51022 RepID=A0A0C2CDS7_9BILA|nr:hypothetical protein ANCDUO_21938 [Ancylostoma duodenale]
MLKLILKFINMPTDSRPQMWTLDDFDLAYNIGKGRFGSVFAVRSKKDKCFVAIKVGLCHDVRNSAPVT